MQSSHLNFPTASISPLSARAPLNRCMSTLFGLCPSMWCILRMAALAPLGTDIHAFLLSASSTGNPSSFSPSRYSASFSVLSASRCPMTGGTSGKCTGTVSLPATGAGTASSSGMSSGPCSCMSSSWTSAGKAERHALSSNSLMVALSIELQASAGHSAFWADLSPWLLLPSIRWCSCVPSHSMLRALLILALFVPHAVDA